MTPAVAHPPALQRRAHALRGHVLRMAEIVWGDGAEAHRKIIPLEATREFGHATFEWSAEAKNWKWARLAVWDVAGDGAFTNPIWR